MRIKNVLISTVMIGLIGYGGLKFYMYYKAKKDIDAVFAPIRLFMEVEYERISSSIFGPVGIKGLRFRIPQIDEEIRVAEFRLLERDLGDDLAKGSVPGRLHFMIDDLEFNTSLLEKFEREARKAAIRAGQARANTSESVPSIVKRLGYSNIYKDSNDLRALGYDRVKMDIDFDIRFDPAKKEAHMYFRQNAKDMGDMVIDFKIAEMSDNINSAVLGLKIKEISVHYVDDSYLNRLLKIYADKANMELEAYRAKVVNGIDDEINRKKIKLSKESISNIKSFINNPQRIIFTAYPFRPVGVESIKHYKPGDVPMLLNIQAHLE